MSKVPLHALPAFVAAARLRNLSRAAASLHVTVSALSHQMRGLEEQLRRKLFERRPRGLVLTDAGERLYNAVAPHYDAIAKALQIDCDRIDQTLTLSAMPTVASSWLVPRLGEFARAHPEIDLNLISTTDLVDFDREAIDAALRYGPGGWPRVRAEHLFDEWVLPVASPDLIARFGTADLARLGNLPLLRDPGDRWREWFERFGGTPPRRYVASFDTSETLHRAAVEGMGVALGRLTMARPFLEAGRLVALGTERLPSEYAHYLVYPERSAAHPAFAAFRVWVRDAAARYAAETVRAVPASAKRTNSGRRRSTRPAPR
jgi:LysR family transcriptional regulator, glycine cleavage system transcriptional activator